MQSATIATFNQPLVLPWDYVTMHNLICIRYDFLSWWWFCWKYRASACVHCLIWPRMSRDEHCKILEHRSTSHQLRVSWAASDGLKMDIKWIATSKPFPIRLSPSLLLQFLIVSIPWYYLSCGKEICSWLSEWIQIRAAANPRASRSLNYFFRSADLLTGIPGEPNI